MNILRHEIRTGLLVVLTLAVLVVVVLYLGAPGVFVPQHTYRIYFDNASGIKQGADVLLAGRKVGRVKNLYSPVPEGERPSPKMETLIEVEVSAYAKIYKSVKVQMVQNGLLGEQVIDFTSGEEASGRAPDGARFLGTRPGGLQDAVPMVLEKIDPVLTKATTTLESLEKTSDNLAQLTAKGADLPVALGEFRQFGTNLKELSGAEGALKKSLDNIQTMTGDGGKIDQAIGNIHKLTAPDSSLAKALDNAQQFTNDLAHNKDIDATLRNFRNASENLNRAVSDLGPQFSAIGRNLQQASDTVKRQPWRLIWPSTKKYEDDGRASPPQPRLRVSAPRKAPEPQKPVRKTRSR
jgi:phospholipid/cholesterol/gamma-HCH transport system substrate-binding protein